MHKDHHFKVVTMSRMSDRKIIGILNPDRIEYFLLTENGIDLKNKVGVHSIDLFKEHLPQGKEFIFLAFDLINIDDKLFFFYELVDKNSDEKTPINITYKFLTCYSRPIYKSRFPTHKLKDMIQTSQRRIQLIDRDLKNYTYCPDPDVKLISYGRKIDTKYADKSIKFSFTVSLFCNYSNLTDFKYDNLSSQINILAVINEEENFLKWQLKSIFQADYFYHSIKSWVPIQPL